MKILKWVLLGLVAVVIIGLVVFWVTLDRVVRRTVEAQATKSLATQTTLDGASVAPIRGKLALDDLKIDSPAGFTAEHILTLDGVNMEVSYGELRQDPVRVSSVRIKQPTLVLEVKDLTKTNIQALMDQIPKGPEPTGEEKPVNLIIGTLAVEDATVLVRPGIQGLPQEIKLTLPTLQMTDVGTGEGNQNGAAIKDVVMLVLTEMASKAADSDQIPPELRQLLALDVKQLTARLQQELNVQIEKVSQELGKKLGGELGTVVGDVLKDPKAATTNPSAAIEQGLGALLKDRAKPTTRPVRK